ncbi:hypothetical protein C8R47DRAFT_1148695 [Mycena vitilis]|nr:hypothetical protein C8R47DRAFT_1148695 [Mycena vitilis]
MFTPPPSPGPPPQDLKDGILGQPPVSAAATHPMSPTSLKRRTARRTRWTVILVPLALVLITVSTRYLTHPAAFDMFSEPSSADWETLSERASDWTPHKRHPAAEPLLVSVASSASGTFASLTDSPAPVSAAPSVASTGVPISDQTVPTIPTAPPTLPNPFPQPFGSDLSQNFSSTSCFTFFSNMTNTVAFRSCRPFSLLLQASDAFIEAQEDLQRLSNIVWGTCNTTIEDDECSANMAWFSSTLVSQCAIDLKDGNSMAVNTQIALNAFDLMRSAGCLVDPTTNTYCYVDAVRNSNPSDTYFYALPLGISMPNNTIASCSACTKSLMTMYYGAMGNGSLGALHGSYPSAAKIAVSDCGTGYATLTTASTGAARPVRTPALLLGALPVLVLLVSLLSIS